MVHLNHQHPHPCSFYGCNHAHDRSNKCTGAYGLFGPVPKRPTFALGDDGSLDTIVVCEACGETLRFSSENLLDGTDTDDAEELDVIRIETAKIWAGDDHACPVVA